MEGIVQLIRDRWLAMVTTVMLFVALFIALGLILPPVYRAEVVVVPQQRPGDELSLQGLGASIGGISSILGLSGGQSGEVNKALAVLSSHRFGAQFISENGMLPRLFSGSWDESTKSWRLERGEQPPTLQQGVRIFNRDVMSVLQDSKLGVIRVRIHWGDREEAAKWANALVAKLNAEMRLEAVRDSEQSVKYLSEQLKDVSELGTRNALARVMESEMKRQAFAGVTPEYVFKVIDAAFVPDETSKVSPRRALLLAIGLSLGTFSAFIVAYLLDFGSRNDRARAREA